MLYINPYKRSYAVSRKAVNAMNGDLIPKVAVTNFAMIIVAFILVFFSLWMFPIAIGAFATSLLGVAAYVSWRSHKKNKWALVPGVVTECGSKYGDTRTCRSGKNLCAKHSDHLTYKYDYCLKMDALRRGANKLKEILSYTKPDTPIYERLEAAVDGVRMVEWKHAEAFAQLRGHLDMHVERENPNAVQAILNSMLGALQGDVDQMNKVTESAQEVSLRAITAVNAPNHLLILEREFQAVCAGFKELQQMETPAEKGLLKEIEGQRHQDGSKVYG